MSKGQKHTPGPWIADGTTVMTSDGIYLHVATTHFLTDRPEANARLIAAAPEMYEALKALVESLDWEAKRSGTTYAGHEDARAAIAKAEGR